VKIYLENQKPEFVRSKNIEEIISLLQQEAYDKELADRLLLPSENEICLKDGILNIDSMQIRPYSPQDYKFIKLPYSSELMANTQKPTWLLKVLNEVCSHYANPERIIDVIQEFF